MKYNTRRRQNAMQAKEKDIEKSILDWLTMFPHVQARKAHTTGTYDPGKETFRPLQGHSLRGVSDIAIIFRKEFYKFNDLKTLGFEKIIVGVAGAIEVKTEHGYQEHLRYIEPGYQPTSGTIKAWYRARDQQAYVDMVNNFGGVAGFATSIEDAQKICKGYV